MKLYQKIEETLIQRLPGWWESIIEVIPELDDLAKTPQPPQYHAEGNVATHTQMAVEACPSDADPDLLWAALLHDIGKASVTKLDGERITAYGHDRVGAEMTQRILQRLQLPAHRIANIVWLVRHHSFHLSWNLSAPKQASKRQQRFAADQRFPLLLELLRVDCVASVGNPRRLKAYELYQELRQIVMEKSPPFNRPLP